MAYNALNNLIDAYIYANGVQAITGQVLNGVLKQMVSQLGSGYHLMGVAGPETVPASNDYAMAYFAATAGEYTDFGGITLAAGEVAVLLTSGNGSWSKQTIYTVPTGTADLENTANFITNAVTDLVNYYTKTEVDNTLANYPTLSALATALADYYTKTEIDGQMGDVDAALADRYTKSETDTKLADYYLKAETYDKDEVDSIVAALSRQEYIVAWDGLAAPDVSAIPAGVTVTYSGTTYTGTLAASASTVNKIYMVWNGTAYDMYGTSQDGGYSWVPMGTTTVDLSQYATKAEVSQLEAEVAEINSEKVVLSEDDLRDFSIKTDGTYGTNAIYKHILVPVQEGEIYLIEATGASGARYAFFSEIDSPWAGGPQPLVPGTSDVDIPYGRSVVVSIPSGCVALALHFGQSPYPYKPDLYRKINVPQMEQDIEDINDEISNINDEIADIRTGSQQNYESGKYLSVVNGVLKEIADAAWGITDFVPYTYDNPVSWRYADTGSYEGRNIAFYNSNKQYINNAYWGGTNTGKRNIQSSEIQTYAQGAAYIRASFKIGDGCYIKENGVTIWQPQEDSLGLQLLQNEITEIDGEVSNLDTRVTELESVSSDGSAASLNKFKGSAIVSIAAKIGTQVPKVKNNFLCFLHISDIHGDAERMKRAIAFANSQDNITAILATGDFSQSEWTSDGFEKTFTELYQTANIPMLPVIGNHDVGLRTKIYNPANSNQAVGARFISPFMTALGCVQGGTDAGYYYKDFSSFKVRLIVVNEYEMPRVPNSGNTELKYNIWGRYISQAQADWLVSTLNSVQSGWSVIIATHQLIDVFSKYDNEFKGAVNYSSADVELAQEGMLQDIVDAYIAKGTLTKTYSVSGADTTEVPDVSVSADFSVANGNFICYINGHTHNDGTGQSSYAQAKQVNINVTTGSANVSNQAVYDDLYRDNDTIAQDAFNLVAFDTATKKIRMLRIGANVTMDMKRRDYALIPYSQS